MTTTIHSNGSKWAGQQPDSVEVLLEVLTTHPLDRRFEEFGDFRDHNAITGMTVFFGNFFTLSHVFQISTDDAELDAKLTAAIGENRKRPDYLAQQAPPVAPALDLGKLTPDRARQALDEASQQHQGNVSEFLTPDEEAYVRDLFARWPDGRITFRGIVVEHAKQGVDA